MSCSLCKAFKGITSSLPSHTQDACPHKHLIICRRCHTKGHLTHMCPEDWSHWERPTSMEELIPLHIKLQYNITSKTPLTFEIPRLLVQQMDNSKETHPINHVSIPKEYKEIIAMTKRYGIKVPGGTKPAETTAVAAIKEWVNKTGRILVPFNPSLMPKLIK